MLGRIKVVEKQYGWDNELSSDYEEVVKLADKARFIYSKFVIKYSNMHLERIQVLLMQIKSLEVQILGKVLKRFEGEINVQAAVE